ncbi:MAG: hypothetical protein Ta2B_01630 [Termitinemataceae bacterium]|nr:MAG: hypothetical protein Ta2B_01630 [Termitinemataceae bacterium]
MKRRILRNIHLFAVSCLFLSCGQANPAIGRFIDGQLELLREPGIEVLGFYLDRMPTTGAAQIDNSKKEITVTVPRDYDISAIDYFVIHSGGDNIRGSANLNIPFVFSISSKNGSSLTYTVNTLIDNTETGSKVNTYVQIAPAGTPLGGPGGKQSDLRFDIANAIPKLTGFKKFVSAEITIRHKSISYYTNINMHLKLETQSGETNVYYDYGKVNSNSSFTTYNRKVLNNNEKLYTIPSGMVNPPRETYAYEVFDAKYLYTLSSHWDGSWVNEDAVVSGENPSVFILTYEVE